MLVQAALNGGRTRAEHPALPATAAELAADAHAVKLTGAFSVHLHPRDRRGIETLDASAFDAAVAAINAATSGLQVSLSTSAAIDRDPFARTSAVKAWATPPDVVSVNVAEPGWEGIARAALAGGIAIEAGLARPQDAEELVAGPFAHRVLRVLVEVEGGAEDAEAIARHIPDGVPQLWHGYGERTWEVIAAAAAAGHGVRVGLEDTMTLPDGRAASGNAELVTAAVELIGRGDP